MQHKTIKKNIYKKKMVIGNTKRIAVSHFSMKQQIAHAGKVEFRVRCMKMNPCIQVFNHQGRW